MGLRPRLERLASSAPVPVFALTGKGARDAVQNLHLREELVFVDSPRPANVLLVAGVIPEALRPAAFSTHDLLSHPRATVRWKPGVPPDDDIFPGVTTEGDPVEAIVRVHRETLSGARPSEAPILSDVDPAPWRGVGPYGHGGSGMTGGVPYGRPLADRAADRDGLTLDQLPMRVGPFFPPLPPGLVLEIKLQGDIVQGLEVVEPIPGDPSVGGESDLFAQALLAPLPIVELELGRVRSHLRWLTDALTLQGLGALGQRALKLAVLIGPDDAEQVERLSRAVGRTGLFYWMTRVGVLGESELAGLNAGPVSRASGLPDDARCLDPAYRSLGFEPIVGEGGDVAARWSLRLAEVKQSLQMCAIAGARTTSVTEQVESPRGELRPGSDPSARLLGALPQIIRGAEWAEAVDVITSLDLDVGGVRSNRGTRPKGRAG